MTALSIFIGGFAMYFGIMVVGFLFFTDAGMILIGIAMFIAASWLVGTSIIEAFK